MSKSFSAAIAGYTHPKVIAVLFLGFSSGLPILLVASTLGAWLSDNGIAIREIGYFAYVTLPYSFNYLWAPVVDNVSLGWLTRRFGRRTSWMLLAQGALMLLLLAMGTLNPSSSLLEVAVIATLACFFSATQDIVIDAYRTEFLDKEQYGQGAAVAVFGYRLGMLVAGAGALYIAEYIGWEVVYPAMGLCMLVGVVTVLFAGEPEHSKSVTPYEAKDTRDWLNHAVVKPFKDFMQRHKHWLLILLFILFYRVPDGFIGKITTPFLMDIGFEKATIATIGKLYGFGATIAGMFIGGALIGRLGVPRCLWIFLIFQIIANLMYAAQAGVGVDPSFLALTIGMDNLSGGMIAAAAIAYMMSLCNLSYTATQYALLSSLASLASTTLAGQAGWIAEDYGWEFMFCLSAVMGIPALLALGLMRRRGTLEMKPE